MARYSSQTKMTTEKAMTAYRMDVSETDLRYCKAAQSHSQSHWAVMMAACSEDNCQELAEMQKEQR